jgi:hypothetical protein
MQDATMDGVTELLARTTLEDSTPVRSKLCTDNASELVLKLRKTFDHLLFFRTICNITSGHTLGSEHLVAGLYGVREATPSELRQWLRSHGENVRHSQFTDSPADQDRKAEILLRSSPLPPIPYELSTWLLISNLMAAKILK